MKQLLVISVLLVSGLLALPKSSIENGQHQSHLLKQNARNSLTNEKDFIESIHNDCLNKDSISCLKYKLYSFVDKILAKRETISLTEGVTVVENANVEPTADNNDGAPRDLSGSTSFEMLLWKRFEQFFQTHSIKVDVQGKDILSAISSTGRALEDVFEGETDDDDLKTNEIHEESRSKRKRVARIIGPLLAAAAVKLAAIVPLALGGIAIIAGKALLIGKIALVISAIIGLKKLMSQKHVTYEVVSSHHGGSSGHDYSSAASDISASGAAGGYSSGPASPSGGWGRSIVDEQAGANLAYRAHHQNQNE